MTPRVGVKTTLTTKRTRASQAAGPIFFKNSRWTQSSRCARSDAAVPSKIHRRAGEPKKGYAAAPLLLLVVKFWPGACLSDSARDGDGCSPEHVCNLSVAQTRSIVLE